MDATERIVEAYLKSCSVRQLQFEPDGNIPPDFLVDGNIAIECRRLNQNVIVGDGYEGIELAERALFRSMNKFAESSGPPIHGKSWFVSYSVHRPLPRWKDTKREMERLLIHLRTEHPNEPFNFQTKQGFSVDLHPAEKPMKTALFIGGWFDHDAGGFVVSELIRNIHTNGPLI